MIFDLKRIDVLKENIYFTKKLINQMVNHTRQQDSLSMTFAALADPTRRAILASLSHGERSVKKLAEPFHLSAPAITKHLKVLERAGLIKRSKDAQWRPCQLQAKPLKSAADWIDQYHRFWEESFDRLEDYLRKLQSAQLENDDVTKH